MESKLKKWALVLHLQITAEIAGKLREHSVGARYREQMLKNMGLVWYANGIKKLKNNLYC